MSGTPSKTTLMFALSSSRQQKSSGLSGQRLRIAAPGQSRRHDPETTVDHPLIRGSKPQDLMRRGAASVEEPASERIRLVVGSEGSPGGIAPPPCSAADDVNERGAP